MSVWTTSHFTSGDRHWSCVLTFGKTPATPRWFQQERCLNGSLCRRTDRFSRSSETLWDLIQICSFSVFIKDYIAEKVFWDALESAFRPNHTPPHQCAGRLLVVCSPSTARLHLMKDPLLYFSIHAALLGFPWIMSKDVELLFFSRPPCSLQPGSSTARSQSLSSISPLPTTTYCHFPGASFDFWPLTLCLWNDVSVVRIAEFLHVQERQHRQGSSPGWWR